MTYPSPIREPRAFVSVTGAFVLPPSLTLGAICLVLFAPPAVTVLVAFVALALAFGATLALAIHNVGR